MCSNPNLVDSKAMYLSSAWNWISIKFPQNVFVFNNKVKQNKLSFTYLLFNFFRTIQVLGTIFISQNCLLSTIFMTQFNTQGFPCGLVGKESACNVGDLGSIPGLGGSPGEGKGCPLQYSGLENFKDCIVHGAAKSQTWLSDFHFSF